MLQSIWPSAAATPDHLVHRQVEVLLDAADRRRHQRACATSRPCPGSASARPPCPVAWSNATTSASPPVASTTRSPSSERVLPGVPARDRRLVVLHQVLLPDQLAGLGVERVEAALGVEREDQLRAHRRDRPRDAVVGADVDRRSSSARRPCRRPSTGSGRRAPSSPGRSRSGRAGRPGWRRPRSPRPRASSRAPSGRPRARFGRGPSRPTVVAPGTAPLRPVGGRDRRRRAGECEKRMEEPRSHDDTPPRTNTRLEAVPWEWAKRPMLS